MIATGVGAWDNAQRAGPMGPRGGANGECAVGGGVGAERMGEEYRWEGGWEPKGGGGAGPGAQDGGCEV